MDINTDPEYWEEQGRQLLRSRTFQIAVAVFILSFVLRFMLREHGFWIDEGRALMTGKNILLGNGMRVSSWGKYMGLHPFVFYSLIAFAMLFFGITAKAGMAVVLTLGSLTCVLAFLIGKELFNTYAGIAAAAFLAVSPIHIFLSNRIITDVPVTFFVTLTLYFFVRTEMRDETWSFYATFIAAGLAILTKFSGFILLPALFFYYLHKERKQLFVKRQYWISLVTVLGLYSTWEIRNLIRKGEIGIIGVITGKSFLGTVDFGGGGASGATGSGGGIVGAVMPIIDRIIEGAMFHISMSPTTFGLPAVLFLLFGIIAAYLYRDSDFKIPLTFLTVAFVILSMKHMNRYFLPFIPMALVISGYGADKLRSAASKATDQKTGLAIFALILIISGVVTYQSAQGFVSGPAQGFTGIDDAGNWLEQNTPEDTKIIAGSEHQIRFFSNRRTYHSGKIANKSVMNRMMREEGFQYVVADRWERTQPQWLLRYVSNRTIFQPVHAEQVNGQPVVVIYRVNTENVPKAS